MGVDESNAEWQATPARRPSSAGFILGGIVMAVLIVSAATYQPVSMRWKAPHDVYGFTRFYNLTEHREYQDLSPNGDAAWRALFLDNGNYLYRQTPSHSGDEIRTYGVGMFHQLHCLYMIRITLQTMNATIHGAPPPTNQNLGGHHYLHCLDYLRQTLLCLADDTIEPPHRDAHDPSWDIVDGQGPRMCRRNEHLYAWAEQSGPSVEFRRKLLEEGTPWPAIEGIIWPELVD